jgi:sn-glycerol 3-phosphate transport system permease protein
VDRRVTYKGLRLGALFVAPQLLLVFVFFYWPAGVALFWAFTLERPWGGGNTFVGLDNFRAIFADSAFWAALGRNVIFSLVSTALAIGMGLLLALFCDRQLRGYKTYRTILVWPYAVVAPAAALAFRFIFAPEAGIFSGLLKAHPDWWNPALYGPHAMLMVIFCYAWKYIAYNFIFLLAGLQAIPRGLVEAAAMDGAGPLRRMRDLLIPLISPTIFFLIVINITESFQDSFGIIDIMTEGGPAKSTELMVYKIYFDGFRGLDYSSAAAQSVVLLIVMTALTFFQFRTIERRVHYA